MEGGGAIVLVGQDSTPATASTNFSTFTGGTFVDAGTVQLGGAWAFGAYAATGPSAVSSASAGLVVDDCGVVDLNGFSITVTSLNSSYSSNSVNGKITDTSAYNQELSPTTLTVQVWGTPGVFGGVISGGTDTNGKMPIALIIQSATVEAGSGRGGLLMTLTGINTYIGGTFSEGSIQIGDDLRRGSITGTVTFNPYEPNGGNDVDSPDLVFDVANTSDTTTFTGTLIGATESSLVKIGGGALDLAEDASASNIYFVAARVEGGTMRLEDSISLPTIATVIVGHSSTCSTSTATRRLWQAFW